MILLADPRTRDGTASKVQFDQYSHEAVHLFSCDVPLLLRQAVACQQPGFTLVDLGCGDGKDVFALKHAGLLDRAKRVIGVDLSELRVERFRENTGFEAFVSSADHVSQFPDASVDLVLSAMVIEHVPDDTKMLAEVHRFLKKDGRLYLSTIFKKAWAWYFRRSPDGRWVLDSTHVREYDSRKTVLDLVTNAGFCIDNVFVERLRPPLIHPILRIINKRIPICGINKVLLGNGPLARLSRFTVPIPRYRSIELVARKVEVSTK